MQKWFEGLPEQFKFQPQSPTKPKEDCVSSAGSLQLAGFTVQVLIFRALLRPILDETVNLDHVKSSVRVLLQTCQNSMQMMIDFVRSLEPEDFSAYWPSYARTCFCYPGQFAFMLCLQRHEIDMKGTFHRLLVIWRQILRTRAHSFSTLRLAALSVDAIFWKRLDRLAEDAA